MTSTSEDEHQTREKIVILGGGAGAMAAAFALTDQPDWQDRYEITIYQLGWRLGGKGASGRNLAMSARIEEHGLHVWLGFYENAFRLIRRCYAELNRPPGSPLATWDKAFIPQNYITYGELIDGKWDWWPVTYPFNDDVPGDGGIGPDPWDLFLLMVNWLRQMLSEAPPAWRRSRRHREATIGAAGGESGASPITRAAWKILVREIAGDLRAIGLSAFGVWSRAAISLTRAIEWGNTPLRDDDLRHLAEHLANLQTKVWNRLRPRIEADPIARHLWIEIDLMLTVAVGMLHDGVLTRGFDVIDHLDLAEWLKRHGADPLIAIKSSWVRAVYEFVFAFSRTSAVAAIDSANLSENGSSTDPTDQPERRLAAGVGLRGLLRLALTYKGAIAWKMAAGMGDVVFAPLYLVLRERGVKFQFFHRVEQLHLSSDHTSIERISLTRQATVKGDDYDPLVTIKGLPCWPSQPRYEQLEEGTRIEARDLDLEDYWAERPPWEVDVTLKKGRDFDHVVFGIALGAVPTICKELLHWSPAWRGMVQEVQTIPTQSCQLWLKPDARQLGWRQPSWRTAPLAASFAEPLSSWADMTHLVKREDWPAGAEPGLIVYFCGPLAASETDDKLPQYFTGSSYPSDQIQRVRVASEALLEDYVEHLWPAATSPWTDSEGRKKPAALKWDYLVGEAGQTGRSNLEAQYYRANVDPSSLYVLSVPGSTKYRLKSDRSGFANLFLAGDWTYNGINGGCIEAAVMSGLRAARGISGYPSEIIGEPVD
jgi:uncharacterized protein with NAD-binding domain and iron-sulfur cluster